MTFTCVYTSTESECKSLTENRSSNFIFTELLKKATTTETVTETEKNDEMETEKKTGKFLKTETGKFILIT